MRCAGCGREVDRRPGELCPDCGKVLGAAHTPATPESTVQGFGVVVRGIRQARSRSWPVRVGSLLLLAVLALTGGAWLFQLLQQSGGKPAAALLTPLALLLFTAILGWRWYRR
ncbi:hypothetical protein J2Z79_000025 [Symbiobacterium terraclitae]|uniref:Zinc ribbon domain-containing protein n=1 Tax=Symbiobacterium terraclitae TaxID=557451 RepID=A0ABS4JM77_9FIRM|nr:hypothetical protein [Symbiobacterium terraclitae]MBP2016652.1 hypothetical protein [Symbiobacterium terraclitae]